MPIFEVTDPATGVTLELEGDSAPSEAELEEIFSSLDPKISQATVPVQQIKGDLPPQTEVSTVATVPPAQAQPETPGALRAIPPEGAEGPSLEGSGLVRPLIKGQRAKPISPFVAALDRGIADVGEGVQQATLELLNKLGIVDDSTLADFNQRVQADIEAFKEIQKTSPVAATTGRILA